MMAVVLGTTVMEVVHVLMMVEHLGITVMGLAPEPMMVEHLGITVDKTLINAVFLSFVFVLVTGCDSNNQYDYDNGYESAWNEEGEPSRFSSQNYREGYEQGQQDAAVYDDGYYDGYNRKKPEYLNDIDYMDGYKDAKKRR